MGSDWNMGKCLKCKETWWLEPEEVEEYQRNKTKILCCGCGKTEVVPSYISADLENQLNYTKSIEEKREKENKKLSEYTIN